ncbi:hypothetical protein [Gracilibacillus kekensis]|uniref:Uncharacterized protein n=1 Tax=Gracilibacillus kekensis TaxID=1027249 RepID=A0A1M7N8M5_9BACI|nr:hypothetical protein [Gracilibacillus kekensis]SHM99443.1 hypothetical protein SAMN05216179_1557 [Gracilibacillus kekensis]
MQIYITIALGIILLIGIGWFVKSYLDGGTVFNNNAIQQYPYALHNSRDMIKTDQYVQNGTRIANDEEELEDKVDQKLDETLNEEEEIESYHTTEADDNRYTSDIDQDMQNFDYSVPYTPDDEERVVHKDVCAR